MRRESDKPVTLRRNERWTRSACHETGSSARYQEAEVGTVRIGSRRASRVSRREIKQGTSMEKRSPLLYTATSFCCTALGVRR